MKETFRFPFIDSQLRVEEQELQYIQDELLKKTKNQERLLDISFDNVPVSDILGIENNYDELDPYHFYELGQACGLPENTTKTEYDAFFGLSQNNRTWNFNAIKFVENLGEHLPEAATILGLDNELIVLTELYLLQKRKKGSQTTGIASREDILTVAEMKFLDRVSGIEILNTDYALSNLQENITNYSKSVIKVRIDLMFEDMEQKYQQQAAATDYTGQMQKIKELIDTYKNDWATKQVGSQTELEAFEAGLLFIIQLQDQVSYFNTQVAFINSVDIANQNAKDGILSEADETSSSLSFVIVMSHSYDFLHTYTHTTAIEAYNYQYSRFNQKFADFMTNNFPGESDFQNISTFTGKSGTYESKISGRNPALDIIKNSAGKSNLSFDSFELGNDIPDQGPQAILIKAISPTLSENFRGGVFYPNIDGINETPSSVELLDKLPNPNDNNIYSMKIDVSMNTARTDQIIPIPHNMQIVGVKGDGNGKVFDLDNKGHKFYKISVDPTTGIQTFVGNYLGTYHIEFQEIDENSYIENDQNLDMYQVFQNANINGISDQIEWGADDKKYPDIIKNYIQDNCYYGFNKNETGFETEKNPVLYFEKMQLYYNEEPRDGHMVMICNQSATLATILLQSKGIPARIVSGMTGGSQLSGLGHARVEYWNGSEWVEMDPTPSQDPGPKLNKYLYDAISLNHKYNTIESITKSDIQVNGDKLSFGNQSVSLSDLITVEEYLNLGGFPELKNSSTIKEYLGGNYKFIQINNAGLQIELAIDRNTGNIIEIGSMISIVQNIKKVQAELDMYLSHSLDHLGLSGFEEIQQYFDYLLSSYDHLGIPTEGLLQKQNEKNYEMFTYLKSIEDKTPEQLNYTISYRKKLLFSTSFQNFISSELDFLNLTYKEEFSDPTIFSRSMSSISGYYINNELPDLLAKHKPLTKYFDNDTGNFSYQIGSNISIKYDAIEGKYMLYNQSKNTTELVGFGATVGYQTKTYQQVFSSLNLSVELGASLDGLKESFLLKYNEMENSDMKDDKNVFKLSILDIQEYYFLRDYILTGKIGIGDLSPAETKNYFIEKTTELSIIFAYGVDKSICEFKNLGVLELRSCYLKELPPELWEMQSLKELSLESNNLTAVPAEIKNLANLEVLNLGYNDLKDLPAELWEMQSLKELYLQSTNLTVVPSEIKNLANLEVLNLSDNSLEKLPPELWEMQSLKELNLERNKLTAVPAEIKNLKNLEVLNLGNNDLEELPPELWEMQSLKELYLQSTNLTVVPSEIKNLANLEVLELGRNDLEELSPELWEMQSLKGLYLEGNSLAAVPAEIKKLENLEVLHLGDNDLEDLPAELWEMQSLKGLYLEGNSLAAVPSEIKNLVNLEVLSIKGNFNLKNMPQSLLDLPNLRHIIVSKNQIDDDMRNSLNAKGVTVIGGSF